MNLGMAGILDHNDGLDNRLWVSWCTANDEDLHVISDGWETNLLLKIHELQPSCDTVRGSK
jgi:hypothetical protein